MVVKELVKIDESMVEIEALHNRYEELVSGPGKEDIADRQLEAKFIRERILRLSLNAKNTLAMLEKSK